MDKENKNEQTKETERLVKAIRVGVIEIDKKLEENYIAAEKAVDNLVTCQILDDFLRDKENTKKRLQEFLKQFVFISDSCESVTPLWKQVFSIIQPQSSYLNFCILSRRLQRGQTILQKVLYEYQC